MGMPCVGFGPLGVDTLGTIELVLTARCSELSRSTAGPLALIPDLHWLHCPTISLVLARARRQNVLDLTFGVFPLSLDRPME